MPIPHPSSGSVPATLRLTRALVLASMVMMASPVATASIQVGKNIIHFLPGEQPRIDVPVRNPDDETHYVEVEVLEVRNPGTGAETRTPVLDPRRVDFLVTPNRFILPPGGKQIVRFVNTGGHGAEERVFRVNLKPVAPPAEATRTAIRVLVAYQVLAIIEPAKRVSDLAVQRVGDSLTVANRGNTNALFRNGVQCLSEEDLEKLPAGRCMSLDARRVHPGNTWTLDLPYNAPVEFIVSEAGRARRQRF